VSFDVSHRAVDVDSITLGYDAALLGKQFLTCRRNLGPCDTSRWRHCVSLRSWELFNQWRSIVSQKTWAVNAVAVCNFMTTVHG